MTWEPLLRCRSDSGVIFHMVESLLHETNEEFPLGHRLKRRTGAGDDYPARRRPYTIFRCGGPLSLLEEAVKHHRYIIDDRDSPSDDSPFRMLCKRKMNRFIATPQEIAEYYEYYNVDAAAKPAGMSD